MGLSQVINHLLDTSKPIPFDFLIDGAFLRTTLDSYIAENGLSSESVITLEYVRAAEPPKYLSSFEHDDWVSSVSTLAGASPLILSGSYDGIARIWSQDGQVVAEAAGHGSAIKSVKWVDDSKFLTSSMDRSLRLWSYADSSAVCIGEYVGHKSTVENIAVHAGASRVLSASADNTLGLWSTSPSDLPPAPLDAAPMRAKKRKVAREKVEQYGAITRLEGHSAPISAVAFAPQDATVAYTVSWDHTIRTWDLATFSLVDTRTTQHPILSLCPLPSLNLLACGSSARHIILHDPRASASGISTATLRGHTNAVVSLSACPDNEWQMASGGHDGTVRVWDVRASHSGNLFTVDRESGETGTKVFDVEWSSVGIVSAGEDKRIQINTMPGSGAADAAAQE